MVEFVYRCNRVVCGFRRLVLVELVLLRAVKDVLVMNSPGVED
jgi:hypothetical protein